MTPERPPRAAARRKLGRVARHRVGSGDGARGIRHRRHRAGGCGVGQRQRGGAHARDRSPAAGGGGPSGLENPVAVLGAKTLDEGAGVDEHGARRRAHAVGGTRLQALVVVVAFQLAAQVVIAGCARPLHRAARDDALPRREREVLRRTHRLAVAALDAPVGLGLDRRRELDVAHMGVGVVVDDHAGVEDAGGIAQALELAHDVVELVAVLPSHVRGHRASGAVFGLEIAAGGEHQVDHVVGEPGEAVELLVGLEPVGEHEVDVAVLRVSEDHAVAIGVAGEQLLQ